MRTKEIRIRSCIKKIHIRRHVRDRKNISKWTSYVKLLFVIGFYLFLFEFFCFNDTECILEFNDFQINELRASNSSCWQILPDHLI